MSSDPIEAKLKNYESIIQRIMVDLSNVPFHMVVQATTHRRVEPVVLAEPKDMALINDLTLVFDDFARKYHRTAITPEVFADMVGRKPRSFRNNEVGDFTDRVLPTHFEAIRERIKYLVSFKRLGANGYPDAAVKDTDNRTTYVEVKATSKRDTGSPRDFYFNPGKNTLSKITDAGRHLLVGFDTREEGARRFKIVGWCLVDLHDVVVSMKPEFNTDNIGVYKHKLAEREEKDLT